MVSYQVPIFVELDSLIHLCLMFHLWRNQEADFHKKIYMKTPAEECNF